MRTSEASRSPSLKRKAADLDFSSGGPRRRHSNYSHSIGNADGRTTASSEPRNSGEPAMTRAQALLQGRGIINMLSEEPVEPSTSSNVTESPPALPAAFKPEPADTSVQLPTPPSTESTSPNHQEAAKAFFKDLNDLETLVKGLRETGKKMHDDDLQREAMTAKANERRNEIVKAITDHEVQIRNLQHKLTKLDAVIEADNTKQVKLSNEYENYSRDVKHCSERLRKRTDMQNRTGSMNIEESLLV